MTHPITPPPELVEEWIEIAKPEPWKRPPDPNVLCAIAARWGADQAVPEDAHGYIAWMLFEGDGKLRPEALEVLTARGIIPATSNELEQLDD